MQTLPGSHRLWCKQRGLIHWEKAYEPQLVYKPHKGTKGWVWERTQEDHSPALKCRLVRMKQGHCDHDAEVDAQEQTNENPDTEEAQERNQLPAHSRIFLGGRLVSQMSEHDKHWVGRGLRKPRSIMQGFDQETRKDLPQTIPVN